MLVFIAFIFISLIIELILNEMKMKKKYRSTILFGLALLMTNSGFRYKQAENKFDNISQEIELSINEEIKKVLEKRYNDKNADISYITDEVNELLEENNKTDKQEVSNLLMKELYLDFDNDVKNELEKLDGMNSDASLICKMLKGESYSFDNYELDTTFFVEKKAKQVIKTSFIKFSSIIVASLPSYIISLMTSCISGVSTASFIPFVGWALAAALIVALIVIISVHWGTIKRKFNEIKAYFMDKFSRIAGLIDLTMEQAKSENQKAVYFPYNPYNFNPINLRKEMYAGTGNGQIWKWFEYNTMIFEWDEAYDVGRHYHILYHNGTHYWPNSQIPEPYASRYFL